MKERRRKRRRPLKEIRLTVEGWIYIVILTFITVGSVLRNVNLLILMAGLMFAPLIINWRIGVLRMKSLSAKRILPHRVYAKQLSSVQWVCENSSSLSAWNVEVNDVVVALDSDSQSEMIKSNSWIPGWLRFFLRIPDSAPESNQSRVQIAHIAAKDSQATAYRVLFVRRGKYQVGPATIATSFPLGLVECRVEMSHRSVFFVAPPIGELHPVWEKRMQSSVVGSDAIKRKRGLEEDEFYALRPWRSGDCKKDIHWRTSAKFGQPIVKQYDQQDNRDFAMLIDLQSSDANVLTGAMDDCPRCEVAISFAATVLLNLGNAVQGRIAAAICGQETSLHRSRSHREIVGLVMKTLAVARPAYQPAQLAECLIQLSNSVSSSTPLYVFSSRERAEEFQFLDNRSDDASPLVEPLDPRVARQLKSIWPSVRWVWVESEEFKNLFTPHSSTDQKTITAFTQKWAN